MKMRLIAPLAMTVTAAAVGLAPIAAAAPPASSPNTTGATMDQSPGKPPATTPNTTGATVVQSPGNVQITAHLGKAARDVGLTPTEVPVPRVSR